jgi:hypothetical protein
VVASRDVLRDPLGWTDIASVRRIGLSLIGLAATEAIKQRPYTAVQIAAAVEI